MIMILRIFIFYYSIASVVRCQAPCQMGATTTPACPCISPSTITGGEGPCTLSTTSPTTNTPPAPTPTTTTTSSQPCTPSASTTTSSSVTCGPPTATTPPPPTSAPLCTTTASGSQCTVTTSTPTICTGCTTLQLNFTSPDGSAFVPNTTIVTENGCTVLVILCPFGTRTAITYANGAVVDTNITSPILLNCSSTMSNTAFGADNNAMYRFMGINFQAQTSPFWVGSVTGIEVVGCFCHTGQTTAAPTVTTATTTAAVASCGYSCPPSILLNPTNANHAEYGLFINGSMCLIATYDCHIGDTITVRFANDGTISSTPYVGNGVAVYCSADNLTFRTVNTYVNNNNLVEPPGTIINLIDCTAGTTTTTTTTTSTTTAASITTSTISTTTSTTASTTTNVITATLGGTTSISTSGSSACNPMNLQIPGSSDAPDYSFSNVSGILVVTYICDIGDTVLVYLKNGSVYSQTFVGFGVVVYCDASGTNFRTSGGSFPPVTSGASVNLINCVPSVTTTPTPTCVSCSASSLLARAVDGLTSFASGFSNGCTTATLICNGQALTPTTRYHIVYMDGSSFDSFTTGGVGPLFTCSTNGSFIEANRYVSSIFCYEAVNSNDCNTCSSATGDIVFSDLNVPLYNRTAISPNTCCTLPGAPLGPPTFAAQNTSNSLFNIFANSNPSDTGLIGTANCIAGTANTLCVCGYVAFDTTNVFCYAGALNSQIYLLEYCNGTAVPTTCTIIAIPFVGQLTTVEGFGNSFVYPQFNDPPNADPNVVWPLIYPTSCSVSCVNDAATQCVIPPTGCN